MEQTFSEQFNLHSRDCNNLLISDLKLSVRAHYSLKKANIIYVSDLLDYTQTTITTIRNLGSKAAKEIQETLYYLSDKIYIEKLILQHKKDILSGTFDFKTKYNLTNSQNKILEQYITAYITLGSQLVKDCFYSSKIIDNLICSLENYRFETAKAERLRELKFLIHNLNNSRSHRPAFPFIIVYSSSEHLSKEGMISLCRLYSDRNALLKDINLNSIVLDEEQYLSIKSFLNWCNSNFEELDTSLQDSLSRLTVLHIKILELYSEGYSPWEIATHFNTSYDKISSIIDNIQFHPTRYKIRRTLSDIIKLEMAIQDNDYMLPLKSITKHFGSYSDISSGLLKLLDHFYDIKYLKKKEIFILDYYQITEEDLVWSEN